MDYAYTQAKGLPFGTVADLADLNAQGMTDADAQALIDDYRAWEVSRDQTVRVRQQIAAKAGDEASLLGTTSDAAALAIYGLASLVAKLATANSLAEVREAAEPFAQLSAGFLAKVESGEVVLPFMLKGLDTVVEDIETRATAVSDALKAAQE